MKFFSLFHLLVFIIDFQIIMTLGCASTPQPATPSSSQVIGLAVFPQTKAAEQVVGHKGPVMVFNRQQTDTLFSVLEMNKNEALVTSFDDFVTHDFVIRWKIHNQKKMDRSQLFLRLNKPRTFVYESDLGGMMKKYVIKVDTDDAKTVWSTVGITPPGL